MIPTESIKYSMRNLVARKARSFLTILSIFVGITTIFVFISFGIGLVSYIDDLAAQAGADKFIVQARGFSTSTDSAFSLVDSDIRSVERIPGVREAAGITFESITIENNDQTKFTNAIAYDPSREDAQIIREAFTVKLDTGRDLRSNDRGKVVMGSSFAQPNKIFTKAMQIGERIDIDGQTFKVVGFYEPLGNPADDANVYFTLRDYQALNPGEEVRYLNIVGAVNNIDDMDTVIERVEKSIRRERGESEEEQSFSVDSFASVIESFASILNVIVGFVILIAGISIVVSAINTANTMITSVLERVKEIGIMKSIGATNSRIRNIFIIESAILGGVSGIIGVGVGWFIAVLGGQFLEAVGFGFLSPKFTMALFVGCIVGAILVGGASGVFPAIQAAKQNPVDALRYE